VYGGVLVDKCERGREQDYCDLVPNCDICGARTGSCGCEYVLCADGNLERGAFWGRYYIWKNLIPTTLGNIVGGGLFVEAFYWYLYLSGEGDVGVSFEVGAVQSAIQDSAGPMQRERSGKANIIVGVPSGCEGEGGEELRIASPSRGRKVHGDQLPHSGSPLQSSVGQELSEKYTKRKGSDESEEMAV
jgi:hypothetical protein